MAYNAKSKGSSDFSYEIQQPLGTFDVNERSGWTTELNLVKWGDYPPKYDIRPWAPDHEKMGKGISLTKEQLKHLRDLLNSINLDC